MKKIVFFFWLVCGIQFCRAQSYSIDWHKIAGGGDSGAGGNFVLIGTIGQHDVSPTATNNQFSVTGGFWSMINVVQTAGLPNLVIVANGNGGIQILWPNTGNYTLQQNGDISNGSWSTSNFPITTANGTNSISITPPVGNLFFRLKQ